MYSSPRLHKWILESSSVDQPLEVGNELGAYDAFLFRIHAVLVGTAVDAGNISSKISVRLRFESGAKKDILEMRRG